MTEILDPLGIWQVLLCALVAGILTEGVKKAMDLAMTVNVRKAKRWPAAVLGAAPFVFGIAYALLVPLYPPSLIEYMDAHAIEGWRRNVSVASWGFACGLAANGVYLRARKWQQRKVAAS